MHRTPLPNKLHLFLYLHTVTLVTLSCRTMGPPYPFRAVPHRYRYRYKEVLVVVT